MGLIIIRGGGDLASGVAACLFRAGYKVLITEQRSPASVRREVSFSEAVCDGQTKVEEIRASFADSPENIHEILDRSEIPVVVDPELAIMNLIPTEFLVDARMMKRKVEYDLGSDVIIIGLGPGFEVGVNCNFAIETNRGSSLGEVIYHGSPLDDTGIPGEIGDRSFKRVLRAPSNGRMTHHKYIGDHVSAGELITEVDGGKVTAPFNGVIRGLIHPDFIVTEGMKIGDVDPRNDVELCFKISDKAIKIGESVLKIVEEKKKK
jgi:xanthine dehydrogenase accessory factor